MSYDFARYLNIRSASMPVLSSDGARVAFLSDISGNYQVWSVNNPRLKHVGFWETKSLSVSTAN